MYKLSDTFNRSDNNFKGSNYYTLPNTDSGSLNAQIYKILSKTPIGIKGVNLAAFDNTMTSFEDLDTLLTPPNELYSDIVPPEGTSIATKVDSIVTKQFIQQFYETYMAPLAAKDIYNRLGQVAGVVADIHSLYPNGVKGLIAADPQASWRANLNFSFVVDEGLTGVEPVKYSSLGFPPFIKHDTVNASDLTETKSENETTEDAILDKSFDMQNILYKRGEATYRFPAFKTVNDNIHLLQVLLNRCFGVESTFINEWDLSMYMQEGLCSFIEKTDTDGSVVRLPQFVTTLTYGLLDDAPTEKLKKYGSSADIDLDDVTPFASVNMAVSTRYGVDNQPLGQQANKTNYIISKYPYSAYWFPPDSGSRFNEMNVAKYIDDFFSYRQNGLAFNESAPESHIWTPKVFHGGDLSKSKKTFLELLHYWDDRNAILSGWNATDDEGENYLADSDKTNDSTRSNAYSYLPFWKLFYTTADDGLSNVDLYFQEVLAADKECSVINAGFQVINMTTGSNDTFTELCNNANAEAFNNITPDPVEGSDAVQEADKVIPEKYGDVDSYSDMSFRLFKCKLKIPGSKLLNMFRNKNKSAKKAQALADSLSTDGSSSPSGALKSGTTSTKSTGKVTTSVVDGQTVETETYVPSQDDLCSKKSVGDGIAAFSPFLYGGPHGKYYSPLTLEGYCQVNNQTLANVPTIDTYAVFNGIKTEKSIRGFEFSKNWKNNGSYIDTTICLTPNEREALTSGSAEFGVKGMKPNTRRWMSYTSNIFTRNYFLDWYKYYTIGRGFFKVKIPNFSYFKLNRVQNGRHNRNIFRTMDYGTGYYGTRAHTGRWEDQPSYQTDWWSQDFKLLPTCGWNNGNWNTSTTWDYSQTIDHIRHDETRFRRHPEWTQDDNDNLIWKYRPSVSHIQEDCVKWLIVPSNVGGGPVCGALASDVSSDTRWLHWSPYSAQGTAWYNQLKRLWISGTREMSVTLPIKDNKGNILELLCGVVNIYKSKAIQYHWKLRYRQSLRFRHGWFCPHPRIVRYYYWTYEPTYVDTYNMYFRPNKVQWVLPTDTLVDQEAVFNENQRDSSSSNIVERWCTDAPTDRNAKRFSYISAGSGFSPRLFPFTMDFIQKYGFYEPNTMLPGVSQNQHTRYIKNLRVLHTKGLYYGDIMESYRNSGSVQSVTAVAPIYQTWSGTTTYTDTAAGTNWGSWRGSWLGSLFNKRMEKSSLFNVVKQVQWTADAPVWAIVKKQVQPELTKLVKNCQGTNSIQVYQVNNVPYMTWYKTKDVIKVFIDTATQQMAWLSQLRDYAKAYLTDKLIYDVYRSSVDNQIQKMIRIASAGDQDYREVGGWTESYTEDINYFDALLIVYKVFGTTTDDSKNTLYDLSVDRIEKIGFLRDYAKKLLNSFDKNPTDAIHQFMRLVTNTRSYLENITTGSESAADMFTSGKYVDQLFRVDYSSSYNILKDPAAILWAYLNVLYQVRRYWVNMRFNKRVGSYWLLRGMERVITFMSSNSVAEDSTTSPEKHIEQGSNITLKTKDILYVQPRTSFNERIDTIGEIDTTVLTNAVYVKVDYLTIPDPTTTSKWDSAKQLYDDKEIVYVNEKFRYAYKPTNGLYYIMSSTITKNIKDFIKALKEIVTQITAKSYVLTSDDYIAVLSLMKSDSSLNSFVDLVPEIITANKKLSAIEEEITSSLADSLQKTETELNNCLTAFINTLIAYKQSHYTNLIKKLTYAVYIKWQPEQVWTGLREDDTTEGAWHIDQDQYKDSHGKTRKVVDLAGLEHENTEAISAGITFDVSASMNPETLLSSPSGLRNSSLLEILCSSIDTMDLWRVELPKSLEIDVQILKDKPVLVPAYEIDASLNGLKSKTSEPTRKSVLAGVASNSLVPILETTESMLTINSLSALGEFNEISNVVNNAT